MAPKEPEWKCLHAHDACEQMLPGPHCPYCVKSKPQTLSATRMTPAQFISALDTLGWSKRHLASLLSCNTNLPSWWADGRVPVPQSLARWLSTLAVLHDRHPPPTDWRQR